ncbi:hypothetical protein LCGC14_0395080 [marine sediment metagenome]|uniref:Uncharacterized protein n=1 Tax=marine sediment metagenome TaxID=412755 RepID=A0A0F9W7D3_9ZZZZ
MNTVDELFKGLSVVEIEQFKTSRFWLLIEGNIKERLEQVRTLLEVGEINYKEGDNVVTRPATLYELKGMQGQCKELRWLLMLPVIFKEQKIQETLLKEQKEARS